MATALNMITRAMRLAGVLTKGETLDSDEQQDGLTALNAMLDAWQIDRLYVYQIREESFTWAANQQAQTVGTGGDFNTDRPTQVAPDCTFTVNGIDYPTQLIDIDAWSAIPDKTTTSSWPWWVYPEYGESLVTLRGYPIPSANITFNLRTWKKLQQFAALTDVLDLPYGYERAIVYNLAIEYGPEFGAGAAIPPPVIAIASSSRKAIKRLNSTPTPISPTEAGYINRRWAWGIYADLT